MHATEQSLPEAERAIVSGLLTNRSIDEARQVAGVVRVSDFTDAGCQEVFAAVQLLAEDGIQPDVVHVATHLRQTGKLQSIGGAAFLAKLSNDCPNIRGVGDYARQVAQEALRRRLVADLGSLYKSIRKGDTTPESAAVTLQAIGEELANGIGAQSTDDSLGHYAKLLVRQVKGLEPPLFGPPIPTGLDAIDDYNDGIRPGSVTVLAARPSVGKSAAAKQIANAMDLNGYGCLIVSHEMEELEITERIMAERTGIDGALMRPDASGQYALDDSELCKLEQAAEEAKDSNLHIIAPTGRYATFTGVCAAARRKRASHGVSVLIVDYLQLIPSENSQQKKHEHIAELTLGFKRLARELKLAVVLLAQLNRDADKETTPREPRLSELRDSGTIEQDADNVVFLWRPDASNKERVKVTLAKWRGGVLASDEMLFDGAMTTFRAPNIKEHPNFHTEFENYS